MKMESQIFIRKLKEKWIFRTDLLVFGDPTLSFIKKSENVVFTLNMSQTLDKFLINISGAVFQYISSIELVHQTYHLFIKKFVIHHLKDEITIWTADIFDDSYKITFIWFANVQKNISGSHSRRKKSIYNVPYPLINRPKQVPCEINDQDQCQTNNQYQCQTNDQDQCQTNNQDQCQTNDQNQLIMTRIFVYDNLVCIYHDKINGNDTNQNIQFSYINNNETKQNTENYDYLNVYDESINNNERNQNTENYDCPNVYKELINNIERNHTDTQLCNVFYPFYNTYIN